MAATTMVHVRVDGKVKARAEKALRSMGLSVSDAVRVLLHRIAVEQAMPFQLRVPNAKTRAAIAELDRGGGESFESVDALMKSLDGPNSAGH